MFDLFRGGLKWPASHRLRQEGPSSYEKHFGYRNDVRMNERTYSSSRGTPSSSNKKIIGYKIKDRMISKDLRTQKYIPLALTVTKTVAAMRAAVTGRIRSHPRIITPSIHVQLPTKTEDENRGPPGSTPTPSRSERLQTH